MRRKKQITDFSGIWLYVQITDPPSVSVSWSKCLLNSITEHPNEANFPALGLTRNLGEMK